MSAISPNSPLLSLVVKPNNGSSTKDILAQFHPIMKSLGFGNFEMEQEGFYLASKSGDGFFTAHNYVFAEVDNDQVVINIDGRSVFGLKGVETELKKIQDLYDSNGGFSTQFNGPNYASSLVSNLLYTALPIYASAALIILVMMQFDGFRKADLMNVGLYATLGVIGAKTRFWVNQRRKQRPVWVSILFLLLIAPTILAGLALIFWAIKSFG